MFSLYRFFSYIQHFEFETYTVCSENCVSYQSTATTHHSQPSGFEREKTPIAWQSTYIYSIFWINYEHHVLNGNRVRI